MTAGITCIYCREAKPTPKKGEHIILAGLGGRATIRDVCAECNAQLGQELDQEFLRNSIAALHRFLDPSVKAGEVRSPQFLPIESGFLDIKLLNSGHADLLPQLVLVDDRTVMIAAGEPDQPLADGVARDFAHGVPTCHVSVKDIPEYAPTRLVIDRKRKKHLIRARGEVEVQRLLLVLEKGIPDGAFSCWDPSTDVKLRLSVDLNVPGRCAAKMAFNLAADVLGAAAMLREEFDPVRRYIVGVDVQSGSAISHSGEIGVVVDYRFVDPWLNVSPARTCVVAQTDWHWIDLREDTRGMLRAEVVLFGGAERFTIRLGVVHERLRGDHVFLCTDDNDWWLALDQP